MISTSSPAAGFRVRPAAISDRQKIADLIFFESHVHRHLDWRPPLDWLGFSPYWVVENEAHLLGALACPPDPASIAWIRLFVFASHLTGPAAWLPLWQAAEHQLVELGAGTAAVIATQRWFDPILLDHGFHRISHIVMLEAGARPAVFARIPLAFNVREMTANDLSGIVEVDAAAFEPLWQNSLSSLTLAFAQASYASVAEDASGLIGYQISTGGSPGAHLARLAVRPQAQRRGLGAALVTDLMLRLQKDGASRFTVNTQADNAASLALYYRLGFRRTGEQYPVYKVNVG